MGKFIIRKARRGCYFELLARNHESIASSEMFVATSDCKRAMSMAMRIIPAAKLEDQCRDGFLVQRSPKFEIYRDHLELFRFRLVDKDGRAILFSEPYKAKASCINGIKSVVKNAADAELCDE